LGAQFHAPKVADAIRAIGGPSRVTASRKSLLCSIFPRRRAENLSGPPQPIGLRFWGVPKTASAHAPALTTFFSGRAIRISTRQTYRHALAEVPFAAGRKCLGQVQTRPGRLLVNVRRYRFRPKSRGRIRLKRGPTPRMPVQIETKHDVPIRTDVKAAIAGVQLLAVRSGNFRPHFAGSPSREVMPGKPEKGAGTRKLHPGFQSLPNWPSDVYRQDGGGT